MTVRPATTGGQEALRGGGGEPLDVVGHQRAVCEVEPGEQGFLAIMVAVGGQVSDWYAVECLQDGADRGFLGQQRATAWIELRYWVTSLAACSRSGPATRSGGMAGAVVASRRRSAASHTDADGPALGFWTGWPVSADPGCPA